MRWKATAGVLVGGIIVVVVLFHGLPSVFTSTDPPADFLDRELMIPEISTYSRVGISVREFYAFHRDRYQTAEWERVDQRRYILHAAKDDPLTRQKTNLAWELLSVDSSRESQSSSRAPDGPAVRIDRLAFNGELAPHQVITMVMLAMIPEIIQRRQAQQR